MQRRTPAKGDQSALSHIRSFLHRMYPGCVGHVFIDDFNDGLSGTVCLGAQWFTYGLVHSIVRSLGIKRQASAGKMVGVESSQQQVGVGDGSALTALTVTGGPGISSGTVRPHSDTAQLVDSGE